MLYLTPYKTQNCFIALLILWLCGCSQQQYLQNKNSFIRGGYAEEVMMQIDGGLIDGCDISPSNVQTSLISSSSDAVLTNDQLISGKIVEKWVVHGCNNKNNAYIVSIQGNPTGMDEISIDRQGGL
jgi:hypothetical protein